MIPALVLTAGLATRLRPLSFVRAKAALPIGELAIIQRILRWLAGHGVADAVLNLHHLPHTITRIVGDGAAEQVRVRYSWEMPVLGSAGGPRHALPLLASPTFLIVNGDTLTNVDVGRLVDAHDRSGALVTMAVIPNTEPAKYGGVVADDRGTVTGFTRAGSTEPSFHFIGVQVVEGAAFVSLPDNMPAESVKDVYPALIATRPGSIRAFITDAEFFDIGTPRDYFDTCMRFRATEPAGSRLWSPGSRVEDAIVWDDVQIDPEARLRRCIVTDGVRVPRGSWENMIIRHANGDRAANEQRVDDLAITSIDGSPLR
ncbi:MAG TPA: sugar phosphate nucleotidyltransferase [Vicinamibacterales bacterium]|nr:sugar phosphate nucleotidyltransferase [Vicinamibacterales bacterium]